ncbi:hypothetical protein GCM10009647_087470 [Streptomyces sanglieri]
MVLTAVRFPDIPLSECTDVGRIEGTPPEEFVYHDFEWGVLIYSPDGGLNECATIFPTVTVIITIIGLISIFMGYY